MLIGEEIDIEAYYGHASALASTYDCQDCAGDTYVDFEHRLRDDTEPVFMPSYPNWMDETLLMEIECNLADDVDNVHHLVMANARANLPLDYDLNSDDGYIEYFFAGDARKL